MNFEELVLALSTWITLSYASISDLRYREVKEYVWVPATVIAVSINFLSGNYRPLELMLASIPAVLVLVLAVLDMMGGADFLALLLVTLAYPTVYPKPVTYLTLIYSLAIPVLLMLANLIQGLKRLNNYKSLRCVKGGKLSLLILGKPMRIRDFLNSRFTYLLTIPSESDITLFECRKTFTMDDAHGERLKSNLRELVERGLLNPDQIIWVTPGLPQIVLYLLGYVAALITPYEAILGFVRGL
ncbi:MAG: A24 family peptidase C-terminal domain-containing protein [Zestosphaera sp.]